MDKGTFEELTIQAMDNLSDEFRERLNNVTVIIEDSPEENSKRTNLLGLYEGMAEEGFENDGTQALIKLYQKAK